MEQLVWAIIIIIFIIFAALKNRARNKPGTTLKRAPDSDHEEKEERDKLTRYMEELFGTEMPEAKPERRIDEERYEPLEKEVRPKPEPKLEPKPEKKIGDLKPTIEKHIREIWEQPIPEKKDIYSAKFPWGTLSGKDLKNAIIFAEILGPPISKRKSHRLF